MQPCDLSHTTTASLLNVCVPLVRHRVLPNLYPSPQTQIVYSWGEGEPFLLPSIGKLETSTLNMDYLDTYLPYCTIISLLSLTFIGLGDPFPV